MENRITDPFFLNGGDEIGAVLVHGYLTAPDEMRPLGRYLARQGVTVSAIRLTGHGTRPEALQGVHWQQWVADVRAGVEGLRRRCERVALVGLSLGGMLALLVAADMPHLYRVVACSTPDVATLRPLRLAASLAPLVRTIPKVGSDVRDPEMRRRHYTYTRFPLSSAAQLYHLARAMEAALPHLHVPTLLIHARHDRVVPPRTAYRLAARIGGLAHILWIARGGHTVVMDYDRARVFEATARWLLGDLTVGVPYETVFRGRASGRGGTVVPRRGA